MNPKWGERIPVAAAQRQAWPGGIQNRRRPDPARDHRRDQSWPAASRQSLRLRRGAGLRSGITGAGHGYGRIGRGRVVPHLAAALRRNLGSRSMPTTFARRGTVGLPIFAKKIRQRLKASALITLHDVDLAVDEVRRAVNELGVARLVALPGTDQRQARFTTATSIRCGRKSKSSASPCVSTRRQGPSRIRWQINFSATQTPISSPWRCAIRWS